MPFISGRNILIKKLPKWCAFNDVLKQVRGFMYSFLCFEGSFKNAMRRDVPLATKLCL